MDATIILGREHHSSDEGEHIEISCFQEEASDQASIQQYHALTQSLFNYSAYSEASKSKETFTRTISKSSIGGSHPASPIPEPIGEETSFFTPLASSASASAAVNQGSNSGRTILSFLKSMSSPGTSIVGATPESMFLPDNSANLTSEFSLTTMTADKTILEGLQGKSSSSSSVAAAAAATTPASVSATPVASTTPLTVADTSSEVLKGGLSGLSVKKINSSALFGAQSPSVLSAPSAPSAPSASSALSTPSAPSLPLPQQSSSSSSTKLGANDDLPDFLQEETKQNVSILSMLKKAASSASSSSVPASPLSPAPVLSSSLSAAATAPVAPTSAAKTAETPSPNVYDDQQKQSQQKPLSASAVASSEKKKDSTAESASVVSSAKKPLSAPVVQSSKQVEVPAAESLASTAAPDSNKLGSKGPSQDKDGTASVVQSQATEQLIRMISELRDEVRELKNEQKLQLNPLKTDLSKSLTTQQSQIVAQVTQLLKANALAQVKQDQESLQAIKQEVATQVLDAMQTKVLPSLSTKLKDSMKETTKEVIKSQIGESFRVAFESSLLPAFQSGIDRLFAQINGSFEEGLKAFSVEMDAIAQTNARSYEELENEVDSLKDMVSELKDVVLDLSEKLASNQAATTAAIAASAAPPKLTPLQLLDQGLIAEAVRGALEAKDIEITVEVLGRLTPKQVEAKCSNIIKLCITQQLAADMSVNIPIEGIGKRLEWIKNLLLNLMQLPAQVVESDEPFKRNFSSMLSAVLESITAAKAMITNAQYDNGEDNPIEIPHSVEVDLQLLEVVMRSCGNLVSTPSNSSKKPF